MVLLKNVHHLQILQFQIVLLQLVKVLFHAVHHLITLQFQVVLLQLVILLLVFVHHLQMLQFQIFKHLLEKMLGFVLIFVLTGKMLNDYFNKK